MSFFVFTTLAWVVKKLLSNQLRYKCHYSIRLSCSILKVKLGLSPSQFSVWLKKSLTGTFTWYSSRLHAMFAFFPLLPQESQFPILPAFLVLSKLYIPSTLNIDLILWHTQLTVCAENVKSWFKSWVFPFTFQAYILPHTLICMCVSLFKFHIWILEQF